MYTAKDFQTKLMVEESDTDQTVGCIHPLWWFLCPIKFALVFISHSPGMMTPNMDIIRVLPFQSNYLLGPIQYESK